LTRRRADSCPPLQKERHTTQAIFVGGIDRPRSFRDDKQESIRGCQYTSGDYARLAADLTVTLSSGRTGQCWDNALAESFFASLKGECLDQQPWPTRAAARRATVEYIAWYNGTRLHSALGYITPDEFETTDQEVLKQVA
jgi:transposase InsO family protein